jgi:hypothetical protein
MFVNPKSSNCPQPTSKKRSPRSNFSIFLNKVILNRFGPRQLGKNGDLSGGGGGDWLAAPRLGRGGWEAKLHESTGKIRILLSFTQLVFTTV